jgi:hypothetical protein
VKYIGGIDQLIGVTVILLLLSCSEKIPITDLQETNVIRNGAVPNDERPDTRAFELAISKALNNGIDTVFIPRGRYLIDKRIVLKDVSSNLILKGEPGVIIEAGNSGFLFISNRYDVFDQRKDASMGDQVVNISNAQKLRNGDILHISSSSKYENGWGYKENDIAFVKSTRPGRVDLVDELLFNYSGNEKVEIKGYHPYLLGIHDIELIINARSGYMKITGITSQRMAVEAHDVSVKVDGGEGYFHRGFAISGAPSIIMEGIDMHRAEYGVLINFSRNIQISDVYAFKCRHAVVPATATRNIELNDIRGEYCQGVLDAHMAFNLKANGIQDRKAIAFSNTRAIGVEVRNSTFEVDPTFEQDYAYWSAQGLTKEYESYYEDQDIQFENVQWVHDKPTPLNGLSVFSCRNLIVRNCTTHSVSCYGKLYGSIVVDSSSMGMVWNPSHQMTITNSQFDGNLFRNSEFVIRMTGTGEAQFKNVIFDGYQEAYLLKKFYNTERYNSILFKDCVIRSLKGWSSEEYYPGLKYRALVAEDVVIDNDNLFNTPVLKENKFDRVYKESAK